MCVSHELDVAFYLGEVGLKSAFLPIWLVTLACASSAALAQSIPWQNAGGHRFTPLTVTGKDHPGFDLANPQITGIRFTNRLESHHALTNHIFMNGSGVAAGDIDGDGLPDLYFCGLNSPNALYRNIGNWKFTDITDQAGVACNDQYSTGAVFADVDGDGSLDLLVSGIGTGVRLFLNDGKGRFTEATDAAGLRSKDGSMSLALADTTGNGALDLYVANYRTWTMRDHFNMRLTVRMVDGRPAVTRVFGRPITDPDLVGRFTIEEDGGLLEHGEPDAFYRNDGKGRFVRVPLDGKLLRDADGQPFNGLLNDWGLSAQFRDINGDGLPDLYVCNDFHSEDRIWINRGDGTFQAIDALAIRKGSWFSMGIDFGDLNRDGHDDFFVADMLSRDHLKRHVQVGGHMRRDVPMGAISNRPQYPRNTLYWNQGDGTFLEAAFHAGVHAAEWAWAPVFLDVDLDGYEDILISTGFERDVQDADVAAQIEEIRVRDRLPDAEALQLRLAFPRLDDPNVAFRNRGDGTFEDIGSAWGFDLRGISQGMALADLDGDGDLDVIINNMNGAPFLLKNQSSAPRVTVQLKGLAPNMRGIGARIRLLGGPTAQSQEMISGGRYLSSDAPMRTFAAGTNTGPLTLEVVWRSGRRSIVPNVLPNHMYEIDEAAAMDSTTPSPWDKHFAKADSSVTPLFEDITERLSHTHHEEPYDDFALQPLLPRRLSQLGPGVAWFDLDGDGHEDLLIGSGRGGRIAVYKNNADGTFESVRHPMWQAPVPRDTTTLLGWQRPGGGVAILAGTATWEEETTGAPSFYELQSGNGRVTGHPTVQAPTSSAGPMAITPGTAPGDWLLFVGGRAIPGRYPEAADSLILRPTGSGWEVDQALSKPLRNIGMVSGAVWSDINSDGSPELILACDWGSLRVFSLRNGTLIDQTDESGLHEWTGCWNGVATGDFNGDGRMDIVATNWGRNTRHQPHTAHPLKLYYGDLLDRGMMDLIEVHNDPKYGWVPWRMWSDLGAALPFIQTRFESHRAMGSANIDSILGESVDVARQLEIRTLDSMIFLNRGDGRFEAKALPLAAQWSPAFGVCVGDLDGDGHEDLFLSQNFFGTDLFTERYDAGRGIILRGDGHGDFTPLTASRSGIAVYGEQRGAALADFDADGRVDLVVSQNGAPTRLFKNKGARAGLRVRVIGTSGNTSGVGSRLRIEHVDGSMGPAREIQAGSGYWSQNGAIQIMGLAKAPAAVHVTWPGGDSQRVAVPNGTMNIVIRQEASPGGRP